jgi:hypothetical protein
MPTTLLEDDTLFGFAGQHTRPGDLGLADHLILGGISACEREETGATVNAGYDRIDARIQPGRQGRTSAPAR